MVDRTDSKQELTRDELAAYLVELAEEFGDEKEQVNVPVGNKTVALNPPERVTVEVSTAERSSVLRGSQETIEIEIRWKP